MGFSKAIFPINSNDYKISPTFGPKVSELLTLLELFPNISSFLL